MHIRGVGSLHRTDRSTPAATPAPTSPSGRYGFERTRQILEAQNLHLEIGRGARLRDFHARVSCRHEDGFHFSQTGYEAATLLSAPPEATGYIVTFALDGSLVDHAGAVPVVASGLVHSPARPLRLETPAHTRRIGVTIAPEALTTHLARLTGEPVIGNLIFHPALEGRMAVAQAIRSSALLFAAGGRGSRAVLARGFRDTLCSTLLLHQPHSHSHLLRGKRPSAGAADVKRALAYIAANLSGPITLAGLVDVTGVPTRTLNEHFRMFVGLSPIAYVRRERLKLARTLLSGESNAAVADIAFGCGFTHLGRFAVAYRRAFGESPSVTQRSARLGAVQE